MPHITLKYANSTVDNGLFPALKRLFNITND